MIRLGISSSRAWWFWDPLFSGSPSICVELFWRAPTWCRVLGWVVYLLLFLDDILAVPSVLAHNQIVATVPLFALSSLEHLKEFVISLLRWLDIGKKFLRWDEANVPVRRLIAGWQGDLAPSGCDGPAFGSGIVGDLLLWGHHWSGSGFLRKVMGGEILSVSSQWKYQNMREIFWHKWSSARFHTTRNKGNAEIHTQRTGNKTRFLRENQI